jgi:hypothetical protein
MPVTADGGVEEARETRGELVDADDQFRSGWFASRREVARIELLKVGRVTITPPSDDKA